MTFLELKLRTVPNLIFWDTIDPIVAIRIGHLLDSCRVDLSKMNTKLSTIPWGYERMSRDSTRG